MYIFRNLLHCDQNEVEIGSKYIIKLSLTLNGKTNFCHSECNVISIFACIFNKRIAEIHAE